MILTDVAWTDTTSIALRHLCGVAVEHGWQVQWCRRCDDETTDGTPVVSECARLELRHDLRPTVVVRVECCDVWPDGSHGLMPWSEHVAGRPGIVRHDDGDRSTLVARLRALGEATT